MNIAEIDMATTTEGGLELHCRKCKGNLIASQKVKRCNVLPSDHWGEMIDSMFCHLPSEPLPRESIGASIISSRLPTATTGAAGLKEVEILLHYDDFVPLALTVCNGR